ncbi:hypothetical protein [Streptomyces collinus]|uniref:hypothetical protein n=1 Tax=Streptomyces collinus TaxID=42684 RepID=UPI0036E1CC60
MAREVPRKRSGRTIHKDQLERLVKAAEREFPSASDDRFSITVDGETQREASLEAVVQEAGGPAVVDNLIISDRDGDKSFYFEATRGLIKFRAGGGDRFFPVGFCKEVDGILRTRTSKLRRRLPPRMRLITDWCLGVEAAMALVVILVTTGWASAVTSACISAALMITWVIRRSYTTRFLLADDLREPWKRSEKLTLIGMSVPIIVAMIVNGPHYFEGDKTPAPPQSGSVGQSSNHTDSTASRAATSALSRDTERSALAKITVTPAFGKAGAPFVLTGTGFEPESDVWVELAAGPGTTLSKDKAERHLVRVNNRGEIKHETITVGRGLCCAGGKIRVIVDTEGKMAAVETTYTLK